MSTQGPDILNSIVEKLQGIAGIHEVIPHAEGKFTGFPAATVRPTGGRGVFLDSARNERTFEYEIALWQETSEAGKTKAAASETLFNVCQSVINAFDADKDFGGQVEIVRVLEYNFDFRAQAGTYVFATFKVEAVTVVPNYS